MKSLIKKIISLLLYAYISLHAFNLHAVDLSESIQKNNIPQIINCLIKCITELNEYKSSDNILPFLTLEDTCTHVELLGAINDICGTSITHEDYNKALSNQTSNAQNSNTITFHGTIELLRSDAICSEILANFDAQHLSEYPQRKISPLALSTHNKITSKEKIRETIKKIISTGQILLPKEVNIIITTINSLLQIQDVAPSKKNPSHQTSQKRKILNFGGTSTKKQKSEKKQADETKTSSCFQEATDTRTLRFYPPHGTIINQSVNSWICGPMCIYFADTIDKFLQQNPTGFNSHNNLIEKMNNYFKEAPQNYNDFVNLHNQYAKEVYSHPKKFNEVEKYENPLSNMIKYCLQSRQSESLNNLIVNANPQRSESDNCMLDDNLICKAIGSITALNQLAQKIIILGISGNIGTDIEHSSLAEKGSCVGSILMKNSSSNTYSLDPYVLFTKEEQVKHIRNTLLVNSYAHVIMRPQKEHWIYVLIVKTHFDNKYSFIVMDSGSGVEECQNTQESLKVLESLIL